MNEVTLSNDLKRVVKNRTPYIACTSWVEMWHQFSPLVRFSKLIPFTMSILSPTNPSPDCVHIYICQVNFKKKTKLGKSMCGVGRGRGALVDCSRDQPCSDRPRPRAIRPCSWCPTSARRCPLLPSSSQMVEPRPSAALPLHPPHHPIWQSFRRMCNGARHLSSKSIARSQQTNGADAYRHLFK